MQNDSGLFFIRITCLLLLSSSLCLYNNFVYAWGADGHGAIGILAIKQLQPDVRAELENIIGPMDEFSIMEACNWPDEVRETDGWEWTESQHYVNVPRGDFTYLQSRDCPEQQCVTEAIKDYAMELADDQAPRQERRQAFAWLCHLTGDLHQPLHVGFADDRGGNDFDVVFKGEKTNLHIFWDRELIYQHAGSWQSLISLLGATTRIQSDTNWSEDMVDSWTNESHQLTKYAVYPATKNIDQIYAQKSWVLVQQQIRLAASRLAWIINTELK